MIPGDLTIQTPPDEPVIRFQRLVAAPPALVFRAWTEPELLRRWWGPAEYQLIVCEVDLRVGGGYRFVHRGPDGVEYGSRGRYLEVEPGRRLVNTFTRDPAPDRESVDAIDFLAVGGGTLVSGVSRHESIAARDAHVNAGMEGGMRGAYRKLDDLMTQEQS
ncbi:MAG TPA: SRPBCC family protein [Micromonosporaceae bacterium]